MSKGRILYTEDDPDSREILSMLLTSNGYEVVGTGDAHEALQFAKEQDFDLLLLDNWLPDLTGVELTQRIREFDCSTPVVFYSGVSQNRYKQEALDAGAQLYLIKPVEIEEMVQVIDQLIAEAKAKEDLITK